jgi:hypothetical protein
MRIKAALANIGFRWRGNFFAARLFVVDEGRETDRA